MASTTTRALPAGFSQTSWRGLRIAHPSQWEPAKLSGRKEPAQCVLVDRRYQRLQANWQTLAREPDLDEMYRRLRKDHADKGAAAPLVGVPEWRGMVCPEGEGCIVHAGRYFRRDQCLVEVVMTWPGRRDHDLERAVLDGICPEGDAETVLWEALGLAARVPRTFELFDISSKVGRIAWDFRRAEHGAHLKVERLAMPETFLKAPLGVWLGEQLPKGFRTLGEVAIDCGGLGGVEVYSRRTNMLETAMGRGLSRLDRAWLCPAEQRVYRVVYRRRARGPVDWPEGLEVGCCGGVGFD